MEIKVTVTHELGQTTIDALTAILGNAKTETTPAERIKAQSAKVAAAKVAPAEEEEKAPAKVAPKAAAKPAPKAKEEAEVEEAPKPAPKSAKPAPKAKPAEEDFNELDEDAQLDAIKAAVTKHTKKGKTADIKQLLGLFDVGRASDLDPNTYGEFYDLVARYSNGETAEDIVESYAV